MNHKHIFFHIVLVAMLLTPSISVAQNHDGHDHGAHDDHHQERSHNVPDHDGHHDEHKEHQAHDDHDGHEDKGLHINQEMQKIIGLTFERPQLREYKKEINVYGEVAQDTDTYTHLSSEFNGVVEDIYVETGSIVDENEPILAIKTKEGVIEKVLAPHHGTVTSIHVRDGEQVDHLRSLVSLVDVDRLRVSFDVYEKDLRYVEVGQPIKVYSTAYPDNSFDGKIVFVSSRFDQHTQTIKIRAQVDNHEHLLRLGMFVTGDILFTTQGKVLSITQKALQQIDHENIVFVVDDDEFAAKEIEIGREFGDFVEVISGLDETQKIVSKGSFALKAEMQKGAFGDGHNH